MVGLAVILGSAPFCIAVSRRLFIWSPFRLHHLKLPVVNFYYKLVALGRIRAIKDSLNCEGVVFRTDLNTMLQSIRFEQRLGTEQTSSARNLMINHELWVAWVKKVSNTRDDSAMLTSHGACFCRIPSFFVPVMSSLACKTK